MVQQEKKLKNNLITGIYVRDLSEIVDKYCKCKHAIIIWLDCRCSQTCIKRLKGQD